MEGELRLNKLEFSPEKNLSCDSETVGVDMGGDSPPAEIKKAFCVRNENSYYGLSIKIFLQKMQAMMNLLLGVGCVTQMEESSVILIVSLSTPAVKDHHS